MELRVNRKKIVTSAIIFLLALFALLIFFSFVPIKKQSQSQGEGQQRGGPRNATTVRVTQVTPDTIENSVIINGEILARNQVTIFPTVGGRIVEIYRGIGDRVNRGDTVAMVDPSRPG
jgi:multidrug efflux pump subunit AcrA (membrane-fusion protein)